MQRTRRTEAFNEIKSKNSKQNIFQKITFVSYSKMFIQKFIEFYEKLTKIIASIESATC